MLWSYIQIQRRRVSTFNTTLGGLRCEWIMVPKLHSMVVVSPNTTPPTSSSSHAVLLAVVLACSSTYVCSTYIQYTRVCTCLLPLTLRVDSTFLFIQFRSIPLLAFGQLWSNPYDVGCKGNWQAVFGPQPFLVGLLPSRRPPPPPIVEFFPLEESEPEHEPDAAQDQDRRQLGFASAEVSYIPYYSSRLGVFGGAHVV